MENNTILKLDTEGICVYIKNRPPLLMIDSAEVVPGKSSIAVKQLKPDEWYFACHFPGNPIMPGVLQLETLFQTSALAMKTIKGNKDKTSNISRILGASFFKPILPGYKLRIITEVGDYRHGITKVKGRILHDEEIMCSAEFILAIPEDMVLAEKGSVSTNGIMG